MRTVSVDYMRQWREVIDEQWLQDLLDIMKDQFANFNEVYKAIKEGRRSTTPKLRKEKKKSFLEFINSPEWYIEQLRALYQRSLHYALLRRIGDGPQSKKHSTPFLCDFLPAAIFFRFFRRDKIGTKGHISTSFQRRGNGRVNCRNYLQELHLSCYHCVVALCVL